MVKETYVSYKIAKLLEEKGFTWQTEYYTTKNEILVTFVQRQNPLLDYYACPSQAVAMRWFREEKGIAIIPIISGILDNEKFLWNVNITIAKTNETYTQGWRYENYENIIDDALKYCLENLI